MILVLIFLFKSIENILNAHLQRKRKLTMTNDETNKQKVAKADVTRANPPKSTPAATEMKEADSLVLISVQTEPTDIESTKTIGQPMETEKSALDISNKDTDNKDVENKDTEKSNPEDIDKNNQSNEINQAEKPQGTSEVNVIEENADSPLRRGSQESTATTTTQTTTSTSTDSTSSSSESSSSSDSSSDTDDSTSEDDTNKVSSKQRSRLRL